jgi:MFS family permease
MSPLVLTALLQSTEHRTWCLFLPMLPQAAAVAALPIACINEAFQAKPVFLTALTAARLSLGLAFVALLPGWADWSGGLLLAAFACYCLVIAAAGGSCQAWFHALLPARVLGSYLGRRNAISTVAGCLCTLAIAAALAHPTTLGLRDAAAAGRLVFAAGLAMAVLDLGLLARVSRGHPAPQPPARPLLRRVRDMRLWWTAVQPVLAGIGGMIAAPVGLLVWYDLGLDALPVGVISIAAMAGGALGFWHGGRLADRLDPARLLAAGAAVQAVGSALLACVGFLGERGGLGNGALCSVGIALAFAGAAPAAIAAMAQTKLVFRRVPDGAAGDFACIGTMASLLGLAVTAASGLLAVWLQQQAADMPYGVPPALPQLLLATIASLAGWSLLHRQKVITCA